MEKFGDVDVYILIFRLMKVILFGLLEKIFMKIIVDVLSDKVVGIYMCGDEILEIL